MWHAFSRNLFFLTQVSRFDVFYVRYLLSCSLSNLKSVFEKKMKSGVVICKYVWNMGLMECCSHLLLSLRNQFCTIVSQHTNLIFGKFYLTSLYFNTSRITHPAAFSNPQVLIGLSFCKTFRNFLEIISPLFFTHYQYKLSWKFCSSILQIQWYTKYF